MTRIEIDMIAHGLRHEWELLDNKQGMAHMSVPMQAYLLAVQAVYRELLKQNSIPKEWAESFFVNAVGESATVYAETTGVSTSLYEHEVLA